MCVKCGEKVEILKARGSYKCPYCEKCFNRVFGNNNNYFKSLVKPYD